ncbi:CaiB/BaiF CoA transferase family protein [Nakamurella leprariae]|nr:CoA transferase [Nakamurella leprariae]
MLEPAGGTPPPTSRRTDLPLSGIRVLDLTMVWAGPFTTKQLADMGAEVIKVEGPGRTDLVRSLTVPDQSVDRPWDTSRYFHEYNRNKMGVAIDVRQDAGKKLLLQLAAISDVLIDNFRPGVLDRLGLAWDVLHAENPRLIQVSLPGYSDVPPERGLPGYGPNVEQMGGLAHLNGYHDGPPQKSGISYGDPVAGLGGAAAVLTALAQRDRTGVGMQIEVGQRNILIGLIGDALVGHQLGSAPVRMGNRSATVAPQGVYPTRGPDGSDADSADAWVAVTVASDSQWQATCALIERSDLAGLTTDDRLDRHDELDAAIAAWSRRRTAAEAADALQAAGVPAGPVLGPDALAEDEHLIERGFFVEVPHPHLGVTRLTAPTWDFDGLDIELTRAPGLGEHNIHVLRELLGYSDDDIAALHAAGVVAVRPAGR